MGKFLGRNVHLILAAICALWGFQQFYTNLPGWGFWMFFWAAVNIGLHQYFHGFRVKERLRIWLGVEKDISNINERFDRQDDDDRIKRKLDFDLAVDNRTSTNKLVDEIVNLKISVMQLQNSVELLEAASVVIANEVSNEINM